jgi:uncharacterized repeat protein (TIGR04138 family)
MSEPLAEGVWEKLTTNDPRYHRDAYHFVREALSFTQDIIKKRNNNDESRHITGQELLGGIREFALKQFGPMTRMVFDEWGIRSCEDFGEIVFNMVEHKVLSKEESDTREDFKGGYDFREAFEKPFLPAARSSRN